MRLFGKLPINNGEYEQNIRVIKKLRKVLADKKENGIILCGIPYSHEAGDLIDDDVSWNGEIDLLLMTNHKTIIYELKAKQIYIIKGTTDNREWSWYYKSNPKKIFSYPFFQQASKQRAFLIREYLNNFKEKYKIPKPNHFVVDSRLVLLEGSDYTNFYNKPPNTYKMDNFKEKVLDNITDKNDRLFMIKAYSGEYKKDGTNRLIKLKKNEYVRLQDIIDKYELKLKTALWFKLINENEIIDDYHTIENKIDEINISFENLLLIPKDLGLNEIRIDDL